MVELLTAYSHSTQAADLQLCHTVAYTSPVRPETDPTHIDAQLTGYHEQGGS
jgi:hypothetical protein